MCFIITMNRTKSINKIKLYSNHDTQKTDIVPVPYAFILNFSRRAGTYFFVIFINAVILINQKIDLAYWQEWKLLYLNDKNGIKGFLIIYFPILFATL